MIKELSNNLNNVIDLLKQAGKVKNPKVTDHGYPDNDFEEVVFDYTLNGSDITANVSIFRILDDEPAFININYLQSQFDNLYCFKILNDFNAEYWQEMQTLIDKEKYLFSNLTIYSDFDHGNVNGPVADILDKLTMLNELYDKLVEANKNPDIL